MSTALLDAVVKKNRVRLIPFMLALYVLAFLDRSNIGFAKQTYQIDTGLSNEAYALGAGIFFVVYAFLGVPANLLMRKLGARTWIGTTTLLWGFLSAAMAWADTEAKFDSSHSASCCGGRIFPWYDLSHLAMVSAA